MLPAGVDIKTPSAISFLITGFFPLLIKRFAACLVCLSTEISLMINGRENEFLISLDSRITTLNNTNVVVIKKSPFKIKMIELENESFLITLREKLMWGKDKRNLQ